MRELPRNTILTGDARTVLAELPEASVDCVVTSPPYYQLRDYAVTGQLGLEPTVDDWARGLVTVARQVSRVLKPTGAFWLNLGDSFSRHARYGAPAKGLLLAPERLVLLLARDGWLVRNKTIWAKTNPMPSSIRDRLSLTWEVLYLLVRSRSYYFDLDAIREPHTSTGPRSGREPVGHRPAWAGPLAGTQDGLRRARAAGVPGHPLGKNPGDVWRVPTRGFNGAHFATFPPELIHRPILATCPGLVCSDCGKAWTPVTGRGGGPAGPSCTFPASPRPGVVLDPFFGTGTVGLVATELGRDWLGIELKPEYVELAKDRLGLGPELEAAA
ncbi:MAG: site-specific DNA-methyltransferase [Actinomycetota bacterium]|nr:site-specific DNA-methyltransferase [Actinomycetota bacterium]